jgi:lipopolysaccharide export system permease protein
MLKILDKYIIRKFLTTFFFMLAVIMLLAMVFDISEKLSDFIEAKAPLGAIIFGYYVNFIVYYGNTFSPMIIFIAVIWFTAKMAQDTEIIPILNSGRPYTRMLRPYILAASFLTFLSLILNHMVLPASNRTRLEFEDQYYRNNLVVEDYHAQFPGNEFVSYHSYLEEGKIFNDFVIEKYDDDNNLVRFLKARTATQSGDRWILTDYWERVVTIPPKIKGADGNLIEAEFIPDTVYERQTLDTVLPYRLSDLAQRDNISEAMGYAALKNYIGKEKAKGNPNIAIAEVELHRRTSFPFATYVLTLIGVTVSSRKKRGGIGVNIAIGLAFVFIYIFAMQITTKAAIKVGFPPVLAVWLPNFIFGVVAYIMYRLAPK